MADQRPTMPPPAISPTVPDDKLDENVMQRPDEPTGAEAPRWSGSAAIPPPTPRRRWWQLPSAQPPPRLPITRRQPPPLQPTTPLPDPAEVAAALRRPAEETRPEETRAEAQSYQDWAHIPPVDPWAEHDTSWQATPGPPGQPPMTEPPAVPNPPGSFGQVAPPPTLFGPHDAGPGLAPTGVGIGTDERNTGVQGPAAPSWRKRLFTRPSPAETRPVTAVPGTATPPGWHNAAAPPVTPGPPAAVVPSRPKPSTPSRRERKRRLRAGELPPPWSPPAAGLPPAPPRRRRKRRRAVRLLLLLTIGAASWYVGPSLGLPYLGQYPVTVNLPDVHGDLELRTDDTSVSTTEQLAQGLDDVGFFGDTFSGVYRDGDGKRVSLFGTTGFQWNPQSAVDTESSRLTALFHLRDVEPVDLGETGVHGRCGVGRSAGTSVVVCSWADFGSVGSAVLTRRSVSDSAELVARLRTALLTRPGGLPEPRLL
jgi:hypothetical protein